MERIAHRNIEQAHEKMASNEPVLPFITLESEKVTNSDGKEVESARFVLNEDAAALIAAIDDPVCVVAIAGLYRTGKSFILNQLAHRVTGFDIGSTIEPCTQGIWLWNVNQRVISETNLPKGTKMIFLDTEGLGSYTKNETYDIQIFSLSVLLTSYFIYNSMGTIDENALDKLSLVVELSKHIRAQNTEDVSEDARKLPEFFPSFMWLLRDFALELKIEGRDITSDDYLERALKTASVGSGGNAERIEGKNQIRNAIRSFFADRSCFTLKRPVNDESLLVNLEKAKPSDFRSDYLDQVGQLRKQIFDNVRVKSLYGNHLNGRMLIELARAYLKAINDGTIPVIRTAWQSVSQLECHSALERAKKYYESEFEKLIKEQEILEEEDLEDAHADNDAESLKIFRSKAVGEDVQEFEDDLRETNLECFRKMKQQNKLKSEKECSLLFISLTKHLDEYIAQDKLTSIDELSSEYAARVEQYLRVGRGPMKIDVLSQGLQTRPLDHARRIAEKLVQNATDDWEKRLSDERERSSVEYERLQGLYKKVDDEWKRAQTKNKEMIGQTERIQESLNIAEDELRVTRKENDSLIRELRDVQEKHDKLSAEVEGLRSEHAQRTQENESLRQDVDDLHQKEAEVKKVLKENNVKVKGHKGNCVVQ